MIVTTTRQYLDVPRGKTVTLFNFGDTLYVGDQTVTSEANESSVLSGGTLTLTAGRYLVSAGWSRVEEDIADVVAQQVSTTADQALGARTAAPAELGWLASKSYTTATFNDMIGLSKDGTKLFFGNTGFSAGQIGVSTNGGSSITFGHNFLGSNGVAQRIIETLDGEVLVSVQTRDGTAGKIYKSTGWNPATANATTWTVVLTSATSTASGGVEFDGRWGFTPRAVAPSWSPAAGLVVVGEYGTHISEAIANGDAAGTAALHAYVSYDHGATWSQIFDLLAQYPTSTAALHTHGCCYDPYDDTVLVTSGDGGGAGGQSDLWMKPRENLGDGQLWTAITGTHSTSGSTQCTAVAALPNGILLLSDYSVAGVRFIPRTGFRRYGTMDTVYSVSGSGPIGATITTDTERPGSVAFLTFQSVASSGPPFILATVNGRTVAQVHAESASVTGGAPGIRRTAGPDATGKVYASRNMNGSVIDVFTATYTTTPTLTQRKVTAGTGITGGGDLTADMTLTRVSADAASRWGLLAHTFKANEAVGTSAALTTGTLYVQQVVAEDDAVSASRIVRLFQIGASTGLTLVKAAVFDSTGTKVGADSTDLTAATLNGSGNTKRDATVGSFAVTKGANYYIGFIVVGSTGPTLARNGNNGVNNVGLTGATLLFGTAGTGLSDMPGSITPSSVTAQVIELWFGLL